MTLRITPKNKSIYAPGSFSRKKINPWHLSAYPKKTKKLFQKTKKLFSSELRSRFLKKALCFKINRYNLDKVYLGHFRKLVANDTRGSFQNFSLYPVLSTFTWNMANGEQKISIWRSFLTSPLWALNFPTPVPGAVKMRRAKGLHASRLHASRNLSFWIGRSSIKTAISLFKEILSTRNHHGVKPGIYPLSLLCDNLWPLLLVKTGFSKTSRHAKMIIAHHLISKSTKLSENLWIGAQPGQFFIAQKASWNKMFKLLNHAVVKKYSQLII